MFGDMTPTGPVDHKRLASYPDEFFTAMRTLEDLTVIRGRSAFCSLGRHGFWAVSQHQRRGRSYSLLTLTWDYPPRSELVGRLPCGLMSSRVPERVCWAGRTDFRGQVWIPDLPPEEPDLPPEETEYSVKYVPPAVHRLDNGSVAVLEKLGDADALSLLLAAEQEARLPENLRIRAHDARQFTLWAGFVRHWDRDTQPTVEELRAETLAATPRRDLGSQRVKVGKRGQTTYQTTGAVVAATSDGPSGVRPQEEGCSLQIPWIEFDETNRVLHIRLNHEDVPFGVALVTAQRQGQLAGKCLVLMAEYTRKNQPSYRYGQVAQEELFPNERELDIEGMEFEVIPATVKKASGTRDTLSLFSVGELERVLQDFNGNEALRLKVDALLDHIRLRESADA